MDESSPRSLRAPRWSHRWALVRKYLGGWVVALIGTVVVGLLLASVAGVFKEKVPRDAANAAKTPHRIPAGVERVPVRRISRPRYETAVGTIKPVHESTLASKILAHVAEVRVVAGQTVTAGEVLIRLDDQDLQARLRQATAAADVASAKLNQATSDFKRAEDLLQKNAISRAEHERADANLKTATAEQDRAEQALAESKIIAEYASITAPFSGTVVEKSVEVGDTVVPGQALLVLYDPSRMQMVASVRESLALQLRVGQMLPARLETLGYECNATISEIVPRAEVGSRTFDVKVTGPCPPGVYSGMFGRLFVPRGDESILVVPRAAVHRIGQLNFAAVADEAGQWQRRYLTVGRALDQDLEVLSGLREGEWVLTPLAAVPDELP